MKSILSAIIIFALMIAVTSCNNAITTSDSSKDITVSDTKPKTSSTTSPKKKTSSVSSGTSASASAESSETTLTEVLNDKNIEQSLLGQISDPNYMVDDVVPYVAWTEINLEKTMYTQVQCIGYEFALPDAKGKMTYDAGIALEIIARTSTGYYRTKNEYYIPCDFLDNNIPENIDPAAATSCTIYNPPETSAAESSVSAVSEVVPE